MTSSRWPLPRVWLRTLALELRWPTASRPVTERRLKLTRAFPGWPVVRMERRGLVSDTRTLPAVLALLTRPRTPGDGR
jgi:hypothetical protein